MEQETSKITFKAWTNMHKSFKRKIREACIHRDQYLDTVLHSEALQLDKEIPKPNSEKGRKFLKQSLQRLDTTPISLVLRKETVELINEVCNRKRIPRDSFINRVLFFLLIGREHFEVMLELDLKYLITDHVEPAYGNELVLDYTVGGIALIKQAIDDYFWAVRDCIYFSNQLEERDERKTPPLHQVFISKHFTKTAFPNNKTLNLDGLNCFIEDDQIDKTPENDVSRLMDLFESEKKISKRKQNEA